MAEDQREALWAVRRPMPGDGGKSDVAIYRRMSVAFTTALADRIAELAAQHGSLRAAARVLEVDPGYLSRLASGEKGEPSDTLLRRMGLRRVVGYEPIQPPTLGKSLLREPLKPGELPVCYCPPDICQAPRGFSGPCNRASSLSSQSEAR